MTMSEWPAAISRRNAPRSFATSSKCRPVVGSSKRKRSPLLVAPADAGATSGAKLDPGVRRDDGSFAASARCPASFNRCASPPESVGTG